MTSTAPPAFSPDGRIGTNSLARHLFADSLRRAVLGSGVNRPEGRASKQGLPGERVMDEPQHSTRKSRQNGVDHRIEAETLEREWLSRFFSSFGPKQTDSDTLLARMRERRIVLLRKAMRRAALRRGPSS